MINYIPQFHVYVIISPCPNLAIGFVDLCYTYNCGYMKCWITHIIRAGCVLLPANFHRVHCCEKTTQLITTHDDVIKRKHFPRNWPLCGEFTGPGEVSTQRPVTRSFDALICVWINGWVNNREAGDLRRQRGHYDVIVMTELVDCRQLHLSRTWIIQKLFHDMHVSWYYYAPL